MMIQNPTVRLILKTTFVFLIFIPVVHGRLLKCSSYLDNDPISTETAKIENRLEKNDFYIARGFDRYTALLSSPLIPKLPDILRGLGRNSIYLDAGSGQAQALIDIIQSPSLALPPLKLLAVSAKKPGFSDKYKKENPRALTSLDEILIKHRNQFKYIDGDKIENLARSYKSELYHYRNRVSLITDIFGPLSYTENFEAVIKTYAQLLHIGGQALIHLYEPGTTFETQKGSFTLDPKKIKPKTLRELPELISNLTGGRLELIKIDNQYEGLWPQPDRAVLWLRKVSEVQTKPQTQTLRLKRIFDEAPPVRVYEILDLKSK